MRIEKLKYKFHNTLAGGASALLGWLSLITFIFILITTVLVKATIEGKGLSFIDIVWISLTRVLDPGVIGGDQGTWPYLIVLLFITLMGVLIFSTLIGILTTSINKIILELKKGRSLIFEKNHTLILGWNKKVLSIVSELIIAFNQYDGKYSIVILGNEDKVVMDDQIRDQIGSTGNTNVICRHGISSEISDLKIANLIEAKSIIIVPNDEPYADIQTIKTLLSLLNYSGELKVLNIVSSAHYKDDATLLKRIAGDKINVILSNEVIAKIIAQTCRQPGLSLVYSEILSFNGKSYYKDITGPWYEDASGDEIYFQYVEQLVGKTYYESQISFGTSTVIGVFNDNGVILNPDANYEIKENEKLIVIAEDAEKIHFRDSSKEYFNDEIICNNIENIFSEKILVINWNKLTRTIINKLDEYLIPGSSISVCLFDEKKIEQEKGNFDHLKNVKINFIQGDPTSINILKSLKLKNFDHIVVLSDFMNHPKNADERNLITLLNARNILNKESDKVTIVSQMLDEKNRAIGDEARADDFIISEKLVSQYMAQISENKFLYPLFNELFTNEGSEIYFNNMDMYVEKGTNLNFYTLIKSASLKGHSAIGYRKRKNSYLFDENYGVNMNPDKHESIHVEDGDQLIVIAKNKKID